MIKCFTVKPSFLKVQAMTPTPEEFQAALLQAMVHPSNLHPAAEYHYEKKCWCLVNPCLKLQGIGSPHIRQFSSKVQTYLRNMHFSLQELHFVPGSTGNKSSALSQLIMSSTSSTTHKCLESALNPWPFEPPTTATRPGRVDEGMSRLEFFWLTWHDECHTNMSKHNECTLWHIRWQCKCGVDVR